MYFADIKEFKDFMRKGAREVQRKETVPFDWFVTHGNPFNKRHGQNSLNHTNGVHSNDDAADKSNGSSLHRNTYSDSDESPEMEKLQACIPPPLFFKCSLSIERILT